MTVITKTAKPSTATMPAIAWYGPSRSTMCHCTKTKTPDVRTPRHATSSAPSWSHERPRSNAFPNTMTIAAPNSAM